MSAEPFQPDLFPEELEQAQERQRRINQAFYERTRREWRERNAKAMAQAVDNDLLKKLTTNEKNDVYQKLMDL